jgi:polyisoprenoid-binding protein YceI
VVAALLLAALVGQAATFRIDPAACEAGFDLKATAHTVHGTTTSLTGEVRVEPEDAGALKLSGTISIGAGSLATGNDKRDATMHSKSLLVASFPNIDFAPERFTPSGPPGADGAISGALTGRLTIRGRTRAQAISATLAAHGERIAASGTFDVDWVEFGVPDPSSFFLRIEKVAHAHFRADFVPAP